MAKNKVKPHENSNDKSKTKTNQQLFIKNTTKFKPHKKINKPVKIDVNNVKNKSEVKSKTNVRNNQVDVLRENNEEKKPFDVKRWRLKKYSKKYKLDQWQEKQKKSVLKEYYKAVNKDNQPKFDVQKIYDQYDSDNELKEAKEPNDLDGATTRSKKSKLDVLKEPGKPKEVSKPKKASAQKMAQDEYKRILEEKKLKREERLKQNEQKKEALQKYKQNKIEKYKKMNKKTRKGQPVMRDRMQMLLEQIQSTSV